MAEETISIQVIDKYGDLRPAFVTTRTEAIEHMAQASCELFIGNDWEQLTEEEKKLYIEEAEIMLNALIK